MVKSILASAKLSSVLSDIQPDEGYVPGLIIGQVTEKSDYVVHLASTPGSLTGSDPVEALSKVQDTWVADHAKNVLPLLPGGMTVLGIFVVGPSDSLSSDIDSSKMISLVNRVRKMSPLPSSCSSKHLVLSFNSKTKKFTCKSVTGDALNASLSPVEWKFQNKSSEWFVAETYFNLGYVGSVAFENSGAKSTVKSYVDVVLQNVRNLVEESKSSVNNSFRQPDERMADIKRELEGEKSKGGDKTKKTGSFVFKLDLFSPRLNVRKLHSRNNSVKNVNFALSLFGHLISRVYVHENATVSETIDYMKKDVIKSLETRLQMFWDSSDNLAIETSVHHPPKRVMYHDPNSGIAFTDYMFIDDTEDDIIGNLEEQLGLSLDQNNLTTYYEIHELTGDSKENEVDDEDDNKSGDTKCPKDPSSHTAVLAGLVVAFIILLLGLLIQFLV